jgi:hypothetical protein
MPEALERLRDVVQLGIGDPPPLAIVREKVRRRHRRRMIPSVGLVLASVLAVAGVAIAHQVGRTVSPGGFRPAAVPPVRVGTSLTPRGWVAVDWGDAQISVPGRWVVSAGYALCGVVPPGAVELGPVTSAPGCGAKGDPRASWAMVVPGGRAGKAWQAKEINGIEVWVAPSSLTEPDYWVVPSLNVSLSLHGADSQAVLHTLTHSPRQVVLEDGAPAAAPPSWRTVFFDGLWVQVPRSDSQTFDVFEYPWPVCALALSLGDYVTLDTDTDHVVAPKCLYNGRPTAESAFGPARPGVGIFARADAVAAGSGFDHLLRCLHINGLDACPYADPAWGILVLRVSGGPLLHPLLVEIGMSGSGADARQILYSMRAVTPGHTMVNG